MVVVRDSLLYDVTDPSRPHLLCRSEAGDASRRAILKIADANRVVIAVREGTGGAIFEKDLPSGRLDRKQSLRGQPTYSLGGPPYWTADGSLEAYWVAVPPGVALPGRAEAHLWSGGQDHLLERFAIDATGFSSRWGSPRAFLAPSADSRYLAASFVFGDPWQDLAASPVRRVLTPAISRAS